MPRLKFEPTDEVRQRVKAMAGFGLSQRQICVLIGMRSTRTLRRHFRSELELGVVEALANVRRVAFRLATSGRNPKMTIRWLERRTAWLRGQPEQTEPDKPQHYRWIIEEYQPPLEDDDVRRSVLAALTAPPSKAWEEDDAAGQGEHDDR